MNIQSIDVTLIQFFRKYFLPMARFGLFVIFFWFGILKVLGLSPAGALVESLFHQTIHFMSFPTFYLSFGLFEMLIGILFLIKGAERVVLPLLLFHMVSTIMPLFLLRDTTWTSFMVPTMEGQYIIKNLVVIACAMGIASHLHPLADKKAV